ncbi:alpha/beta hydrolase [Nocardia sp. NBC_00565]|uniref:alpha/beta fold hydrolase n=1 Tax=Nocardia sp. NBC_00565 TaxID=2975993 RepID=UPI002E818E55|nr:alpha/beta fold hydrolase [Nocardia sp. NBC_00565]WUC02557.1 alpha/beta hydrolase [Nocardia sp. NBC_00565]
MVNWDAPTIDFAPTAEPVGYHRLHPDRGMEFQLDRFLQWIGPAALAELRTAADRIGSYADWVEVFLELAQRARATDREFSAAYYDRAAEFFMPVDDPRRAPARTRFVRAMRDLYQLSPVDVPYGAAALPTYDLRPEGLARGVIVVCGGFDEYTEEIFPLLLAGARAGYRVIAFDGPGQGGALLDHGLPMTAAWEGPVAAVLDHFGLDDVTLIGVSLGGGLAIRAAAFEPRIRRVIALDVLDDFLECLGRQAFPGATPGIRLALAVRARHLVNLTARLAAARKPIAAWGLSQGMHVTGTKDAYEFFRAARDLSSRAVSHRVTADALLLAGSDDHYVPARQLHRQAAALTHARSVTTRLFTPAEQAHNHCQIGNIGCCLGTILTWLQDHERAAEDVVAGNHTPTS